MPRIVYNNGAPDGLDARPFQNYISTTLYTFYDFLPRSVWNQVSRVTNIYFIVQCVISFFPQISTISVLSAVGPVIFVICFSIAFDLAEDFLRYLKDRKANRRKAWVLADGQWTRTQYQHVKPGDLVRVQGNQEICADLLLLSFRSPSPYAYIETANLDGEKNLKPRIPVLDKFLTDQTLLTAYPSFSVDYQPPIEFLERFDGAFLATSPDGRHVETRLSIANFLPRSCILKNTDEAVGLAVYTGKDTKIMKNTKNRKVKVSLIEQKMNIYILVLVLLLLLALLVMATYAVLLHRHRFHFEQLFFPQDYSYGVQWVFTLLRYFLIMNTIVPISLIVTLQIAKTIMSAFYLLEKKKDHVRVWINTMNIHEELGQIEYVLSDKTGTLTRNKMVLKHFQTRHKTLTFPEAAPRPGGVGVSAEVVPLDPFELVSGDGAARHVVQSEDDMDFLYFVALNTCHECFAEASAQAGPSPAVDIRGAPPSGQASEKFGGSSRNLSEKSLTLHGPTPLARDLTLAATLPDLQETPIKRDFPNSETGSLTSPNFTDTADNFRTNAKLPPMASIDASKFELLRGSIEIQGPSPDEIAILRASKNFCGFLFKGSTASETVIMDREGYDIEVRLLQTNKFNSLRKMMSVVAEVGGSVFVFAKGADSMVSRRLKQHKTPLDTQIERVVAQKCDVFVNEGLRIMYVAAKVMSRGEWDGLAQRIRLANQSPDYDAQMERLQLEMESDLTLLGATAIEDRLQENLQETVAQIQKANIKFWVITGDKLETAENIAYASGVFRRDRQLVSLRHPDDLSKADDPLHQNLIVDGEFFGELLMHKGPDLDRFKSLVMAYQNVVFSRTNANQKVEVVKIVNSTGKVTLAIGDGANDVNMIQEANVGVGIHGEEGKQASNSSDFAIRRFADLSELLFNHGRLSYTRVSDLIMFFFYKNFMFTVPQFVYAFYCDFSGTPVYIDYYITFYNMLFTAFVASARSVYNKDVYGYGAARNRTIEIHTYYLGQRNRGLNPKNFALWLATGTAEVLLLFYFVYAAYRFHAYDLAHEATYEFTTMLVFSVIVFSQVNKITYQTNIFLTIQALFYSTGYWIFILYFIITDFFQTGGMYKVNQQLWFRGGFWLPFMFALGMLTFLNFLYYKFQERVYPTVFNEVRRRIERDSDADCEAEMLAIVAEVEGRRGLGAFLFN